MSGTMTFPVQDHYVDLAAGRFASTSAADLERIFGNVARSGCDTLVVHFHGGLNTREDGIKRVEEMRETYIDAGAYPLFFVWQSWVSEVIGNGFVSIFDEPMFQALRSRVRDFVAERMAKADEADDGASGGVRGLLREALERAGEQTERLRDIAGRVFRLHDQDRGELLERYLGDAAIAGETKALSDRMAGDGAAGPARKTLLRPEFVEALGHRWKGFRVGQHLAIAGALVEVTFRVCERHAKGRDHGLEPTIVEEILRRFYFAEDWFSWMKLQIEDAFQPDAQKFGGTALLQHLQRMRESGRPLRTILVGHSAGSIYCCNVVDHAKTMAPEQSFELCFLAPAVTFERFARTLACNGQAIRSMRNFALSDVLERKDRWVPRIPDAYSASLLYFTSGLMERDDAATGDVPVVGMERYYGAVPVDTDENRKALDYLRTERQRVCWAGVAGVDPMLDAEHHSGFDANPTVRAALTSLIRAEPVHQA